MRMRTLISKKSKIGVNVKIAETAYIGDDVEIGDGSIIQHGAYIEGDCKIGRGTRIGTYAVIRPGTVIGDGSVFGSLSVCEGDSWLGNKVTVHSQCHVTSHMVIEDQVFIGPMFMPTNTKNISHGRAFVTLVKKGPHVKFGARIGAAVTILPNVVIERESFVAAGSLVTKDTKAYMIVMGVPAQEWCEISASEMLPLDLFVQSTARMQRDVDYKRVMELRNRG